MLLRIEDIDTGRSRPYFVDGIFEDLNWLGLSWREPVRRQSEHFEDYRAAWRRLLDRGLLYPCTATRKQISAAVADRPDWPCDPDGAPIYPGLAKNTSGHAGDVDGAEGDKPAGAALRIDMERAIAEIGVDDAGPLAFKVFEESGEISTRSANPRRWGNAVIVRKDTPTSYHLSVVVDDALQGITHISRGQDLEAATDLHVLLQRLLGLPTPHYYHHHLIVDSKGQKLSKSLRDTSLEQLRNAGWNIQDVYAAIGLNSRIGK